MREAVREGDGCDYVFIINSNSTVANLPPLLSSNARYVHHANECFDWGSFGWFLRSNWSLAARYQWYV